MHQQLKGEAMATEVPRSDMVVPSDALEELHRREYAGMVGLAVLLVDDERIAEEVVQDAFLAVHRRLSEHDQLDNPAAYLRRSVINGGRDVQRRREVRRRIRLEPTEPTQFRFAELDDTLARLPYKQRSAIVLRYVMDLPESAIADALGVAPNTVRTLIHRGLQQLRREVKR